MSLPFSSRKAGIAAKLFGAFGLLLAIIGVIVFAGAATIATGAQNTQDVKGDLTEIAGAVKDIQGVTQLRELGVERVEAVDPAEGERLEGEFDELDERLGERFDELLAEAPRPVAARRSRRRSGSPRPSPSTTNASSPPRRRPRRRTRRSRSRSARSPRPTSQKPGTPSTPRSPRRAPDGRACC